MAKFCAKLRQTEQKTNEIVEIIEKLNKFVRYK